MAPNGSGRSGRKPSSSSSSPGTAGSGKKAKNAKINSFFFNPSKAAKALAGEGQKSAAAAAAGASSSVRGGGATARAKPTSSEATGSSAAAEPAASAASTPDRQERNDNRAKIERARSQSRRRNSSTSKTASPSSARRARSKTKSSGKNNGSLNSKANTPSKGGADIRAMLSQGSAASSTYHTAEEDADDDDGVAAPMVDLSMDPSSSSSEDDVQHVPSPSAAKKNRPISNGSPRKRASATTSTSSSPSKGKTSPIYSPSRRKRKSPSKSPNRRTGGTGSSSKKSESLEAYFDADGEENVINSSTDSTLSQQQQQKKKQKIAGNNSKGGAGGTRMFGGNTAATAAAASQKKVGGAKEVITLVSSREEDEEDDDDEVQVVPNGGKRRRGGSKSGSNNSTSKAKAKAIDGKKSAPASSAPASSAASAPQPAPTSSASATKVTPTITTTPQTVALALVRVPSVGPASSRADVDLTAQATQARTVYPLRKNTILGRTGVQNAAPNKLDIGIGADADGVSRRQVRVKVITVEGNVDGRQGRHRPSIKCAVCNPTSNPNNVIYVAVAAYGPVGRSNAHALRYELKRRGDQFQMNVGDCIVFDAYNGNETGGRNAKGKIPKYVYRLVRCDLRGHPQAVPTAATTSSVGRATTESASKSLARTPEVQRPSNSSATKNRDTAAKPTKAASTVATSSSASSSQPVVSASTKKRLPDATADRRKNDDDVIDVTVPKSSHLMSFSSSDQKKQSDRNQTLKAQIKAKAKAKADMKVPPLDVNRQSIPSSGQPPMPEVVSDTDKAPVTVTKSFPQTKARTIPPVVKEEEAVDAYKASRIQQPLIGDRFRVLYEEDSTNFLGVKETHWYCGTVTEVEQTANSSQTFQVKVQSDDRGTYDITYPGKDNDRLVDMNGKGAVAPDSNPKLQGRPMRRSKSTSDAAATRVEACAYSERDLSDGATASECEPIFDPNPSQIFVGDLVDCHYQNGLSNGQWFRGRVARVAVGDNVTLFDVAYNDDFEYERNVPLLRGNVRLFKRGSYDISWMLGVPFTKGKRTGAVVAKEPKMANANISIKYDDGSIEKVAYEEVVVELFSSRLSQDPAIKMLDWPISFAQSHKKVKAGTKRKVKVEEPEEDEPPTTPTKKSRAASDAEDRISKKAPARRNDVLTSTQIDELLNAPQESQCSQESYADSPDRPGALPRATEMHASVASALWNSLNSAEPHNSAALLRHSAVSHHILPNVSLSGKMFNLMKTGPQNEGVSFRDPNRMHLGYDYMMTFFAASETLEKGTASFGPSSWADMEHCLAQPITETAKMSGFFAILESESLSAMRRLGEALHVAASGLSCVEELLQSELKEAKEYGITSSPRHLYATSPTILTALETSPREALKSAVRYAMKCWVRHGHFIIGDGEELKSAGCFDEDWCANEARQCLDSFGSIVSNLAWLYCAEEGINISDNDCAFLIKDALLSELEKLRADGADFGFRGNKKPTVAAWKKFSKRAKIWFVLSLQPTLQPNLGKMLNISKEIKCL